jgi:hypothetical protein
MLITIPEAEAVKNTLFQGKTPELYIHERKPIVGPVEIDFEQYPNIKAAYIFNSQYGAKDILDPSTESTPQGSAIVGPFGLQTFGQTNDSMYIGTNKLNDICDGAQVVIFHIGLRPRINTANNFILDAYLDGTVTNSFYIIANANGAMQIGGRSQVGETFESGLTPNDTIKLGKDHFFEIIYDYPTNKIIAYKDDREILDQTVTWDSDTFAPGVSTVQDGLAGAAHRSRISNMYIYHFVVETYARRPLTLRKRSSTRNPYGFLKQSRPDVFIGGEPIDSGFHIPDARAEMPELYFPRRKPIGPVELDFSNPLTHKLEGAFLFPSMENYVPGGFNLSSSKLPPIGVGPGGACFAFTTDQDEYLSGGDSFDVGRDHFTLTAIVSSDYAASPDMALIAKAEASSNNERYQLAIEDTFNEGTVRAFIDNGVEYDLKPGVDILDGKVHVAAMRVIRTGLMSTWADGIQQGTTDISATGTNNMDSTHVLLFGHYNDSVGSNDPPTGQVNEYVGNFYAAFLHRRALTDAEMKSLAANPYQFLIPK